MPRRCRSRTRASTSVLSTFGVMFAPDHDTAREEMLRVVRHGGRIGLANWTPEGFIGQLFRVIGTLRAAARRACSRRRCGARSRTSSSSSARKRSDIRCVRRNFDFRYESAAHWVQIFRDYYGPTLKAFAALDATGQRKLETDLVELLERFNVAGRASLVVPGEYLEIVIVKH